ncbi:MAG: enoyl-CoA hydratase-related protein [Acidimicrobiia bacterium]|nr:enoyl-CoA hydratase-related protein [Acidimicrobiia bacterium]MDH4362910.1 enoyl-CoA hydratase-related protein [Acidimicrobiia bacterium]MDH5289228.1 enoyl-CoA hydratase-related protein [Acidimicrobiia bacterium]
MTDYRHLQVETDGGCCRITLSRPDRLNALNIRIGIELLDVIDAVERDRSVRAVVLTGAGRAFCAGDDLRDMADADTPLRPLADPIEQYTRGEGRWPLIVHRLRAMPKPVIARVNGHAHGAGFNLALACDFRVMAQSATLAIPFVRRGLATGTSLLQQYVGIGKALEWAMRGATLSAAEAERWGLVTAVTPDNELDAATGALVAELATGPTRVLGITKAAVYHSWEAGVDDAYRQQGLALHLARATADFDEGRQAFIEKRPPNFSGR